MARKNKRSQTRKPQRGGTAPRPVRPAAAPPVTPAAPGADIAAAPASASAPAPGRMMQRPLPRTRVRQGAGPLPPEDAAIPMDRVPYFRGDLLRIALTAGVMLVLLIVGSFLLRGMLGA